MERQDVVTEVERIRLLARSDGQAAVDACRGAARRLAAAALPEFHEEAARIFLSEGHPGYAARMFERARQAEADHALEVDEERLDAAYLEFALAGAVGTKALVAYARELVARRPAGEAFERFARLCVRRTAGGLVPSVRLGVEVRRLARAAGGRSTGDVLAELLALPATARAAGGWWKAQRGALVELARERAVVRGVLLDLMPDSEDEEVLILWLEVLEESGALAGLRGEGVGPRDGTAGWFVRFLEFHRRALHWATPARLPVLYRLVEDAADRLRAELAESGRELEVVRDVDLLDLLLALEVPVAPYPENWWLPLGQWAAFEDRRDLLALAADGRFGEAFRRSADGFGGGPDDLRTVEALAAVPGGRLLLADWLRAAVRRLAAAGLPALPEATAPLTWLPAEVLRLAEAEIRAVTGADLAPLLARTLRAGLLDELGWPAWDEAVRAVGDADFLRFFDAWPQLVVAGPAEARVIGAEGTVLVHALRLPAEAGFHGPPGFHYVDGELLVHWATWEGGTAGYWHRSPDRIIALEGGRGAPAGLDWYREEIGAATLPLPGGGRATGFGVLRRGGTALPPGGFLLGDGTSYWTWGGDAWLAYDPVRAVVGGESVPAFLDVPEVEYGTLLPLPQAEPGAAVVPVGGLVGWRVVRLPDGSRRGEDLAGRRVTVPGEAGLPCAAVLFPGAGQPVAASRETGWALHLVDGDGVVLATARVDGPPGAFARGTPVLPPPSYWHCLRPRDVPGSLALRQVDEDTARGLLRAADPAGAVRELLPQVTDGAVVAGIAGVVGYAAGQQAVLDAVTLRLDEVLGEEEAAGPSDGMLCEALEGLTDCDGGHRHDGHGSDGRLGGGIEEGGREAGERGAAEHGADEHRDGQHGTAEHGADEHRHRQHGTAEHEAGEHRHGQHSAGRRQESGPGTQARGQGPRQGDALRRLRTIGRALRTAPRTPAARLHLDGLPLPPADDRDPLPYTTATPATAFRAAAPTTPSEHRRSLEALLTEVDALGLASGGAWRRVHLRLDAGELFGSDGEWREGAWAGALPLDGGRVLALTSVTQRCPVAAPPACLFTGLLHDPSGRFEVPAPYAVEGLHPVGEEREERDVGWLGAFLGELAVRGPAPWFPAAAEEFARLTGVTGATARLVVAGLPEVGRASVRTALGIRAKDTATVAYELGALPVGTRQAVVAALLPGVPARLWTDGPDASAAARVWNARVGRRTPVPEELLGEVLRAVRPAFWDAGQALRAFLDPDAEPRLSRDLEWEVGGSRVLPVGPDAGGFTAGTLVGTVALAAWLAHRLPVGDPVRAALPAVLDKVRERLAHPGLLLDLGRGVHLPGFGTPSEVGAGFERYGGVVIPTFDALPTPALSVAHLDGGGEDPYVSALRDVAGPFPVEVALRVARDPGFAALLDPPGAGVRWPQHPAHCVPDLVAEAARVHDLGEDAAALYLMLLAMPDPTDRDTARWTAWPAPRLRAARAQLAAAGPVVQDTRRRAGRTLFLPGDWLDPGLPHRPLERWKAPLYGGLLDGRTPPLGVLVPLEPAAGLYRRAWQRIRHGDTPTESQDPR
ncbi:DNA-binding protein [Streptomyces sp. 4F14]|uniref:DNA-binding protein n=1 Tax=Streptomyces sp. 4F14 TaxID=3394380 RepID=UPI003A875AC1